MAQIFLYIMIMIMILIMPAFASASLCTELCIRECNYLQGSHKDWKTGKKIIVREKSGNFFSKWLKPAKLCFNSCRMSPKFSCDPRGNNKWLSGIFVPTQSRHCTPILLNYYLFYLLFSMTVVRKCYFRVRKLFFLKFVEPWFTGRWRRLWCICLCNNILSLE